MRTRCLIALSLLIVVVFTGCGSSWIAGNAVKSPIEGAEVKVFRFDAVGSVAELPGANAPVTTGPTGAYAFGLDPQTISDEVAGPLIVRTVGGVMGGPSAPAPTLEAVIPNPVVLANQDISVTTHLSLASSVAAGLLQRQALELGAAPTASDARDAIAQVEAAFGVGLEGDPAEPARAVCMLNTCVDQNLDLVSTPTNNPAVNEFIQYLVANLSSSSGLLDGMMDDPASPGTDIPASFSPFKSGVLTSILPGGPPAFMNLAFSTDKEFIECNGLDYACLTAILTDAEGTPLAAVEDVSIAIASGTAVLDHALPTSNPGQKQALLTSTTVGDVAIRASYILANGNTITHDLTIGVINLQVDTDGDGFSDGAETLGWDIIVDENGYGGATEAETGAGPGLLSIRHVTSDPNRSDTDMDGLSDYEEYLIQCDPQRVDTDGDGLTDHAECTQWMTSPCSVDSDSDARGPRLDLPPAFLLFDGNEVHLNGTSPTLDDTDGDGWTDREELDHPARSPIVADLPRLDIKVVDAVDVRLDVEYAEETGMEHEYGTEFTESSTQSFTHSHEIAVSYALETATKLKAGIFDWGSTEFKQTFGIGYTLGLSQESSRESQDSYQDYVTDSRTYTETAANGSMTMGVQLENTGDTAFTLTHLAFAARHWQPGANGGAKSASGSFSTLATLAPQLGGGIALAPGEATPVIQVQASDVNASRIKDLLAQPDSLHLESAAYEIENADGLSFAYLEEITRYRTARITIDHGDGRLEDYRVATNAKRGPGGSYAGVTLGNAMGDILGIPYETRPRQTVDPDAATNEQVLYAVRDVATHDDPAKGFWIVSVASTRPEPLDVDFDDIVLQAADEVLMMYVRDEDGDGLTSPEEQHYRTDDSLLDDTDGDGLTDAEEVRVEYTDENGDVQQGGWDVAVYGGDTYHVFSDPTSVDQDGDGLSDFDEKAAGTDPTLADTDGDGLPDGSDPYPLHPAGILHVKPGERAVCDGLAWGTAFKSLQDALTEAAIRNADVDNPGNDISEIWVAAGVYKPGDPGSRAASFELLPAVGIYGGFQGVDTETKQGHRNPNPLTNSTVLFGDLEGDDETGGGIEDNSYHVVTASSGQDSDSVLDGFQITGGNANILFSGGGGMLVTGSSPTLRNLLFRENSATYLGGALYVTNGAGTIVTGCTFSNNESGGLGGGVQISQLVEPTDVVALRDCEFSENVAANGGGLSYSGSGSEQRPLVVDRCLFVRNEATYNGGGAHLANGIHHITNTRFRLNQGGGLRAEGAARLLLRQSVWWKNTSGPSGAGVHVGGDSRAWVMNCTFAGNASTDDFTYGGGLFMDTQADATVENCVLWGNTTETGAHGVAVAQLWWDGRNPGDAYPTMSCVEVVYWFDIPGSGNTGGDPDFENADTGDLRIGPESSCIDTGETLVDFDPFEPGFQPLPETDIGGLTRIVDGDSDGWIAVDMGAHEYQGGAITGE